MNKKFLTNSLKAIIGLASIVFLHSYIHNITDTTLPENLKNSDNKVQIWENKINNIKIEELQNEIIKNKLELLKINLEECNQNSNREIGLLKSMDKTSIDSQNKIEYHTNNFITCAFVRHATYCAVLLLDTTCCPSFIRLRRF